MTDPSFLADPDLAKALAMLSAAKFDIRTRSRQQISIDGSLLELTPERAVRIQENLGSDIAMCLDECAPGEAPGVAGRGAARAGGEQERA